MRSPITKTAVADTRSGFLVSSQIELHAVSAVCLPFLENVKIEIPLRAGMAKNLLLPELSAQTLGST
jgi:hypothetical protein